MEDDESLLEGILDGDKDPTDLPLALLQKITNNFSKERKIGQGGFGAVYKGVFRERVVAVKKIYVNLEKIDDDDKQFGREINSLWNTNHQNVVRFLGFCSNIHQKHITKDGKTILANVRERLFCFEYISNGSLDKHITDELRGHEWKTRYEIITGICDGLCYLHEEKEFIHMDLKPANILLDHQDEKYIPKITDFGLSRPNKNSHTEGRCYGTLGYWAPENRDSSKTIYACDIYGLGAIIMELVTGGIEGRDKHNVLRRWRHRWSRPPTPLQYQQVTRCIEIALRCREQEPEARPSIKEIIDFLSKPESTDGHSGQEISTYMDDDMLGIEPLKLHFNKEMPWSLKLTNKTKTCFSFNIEEPSQQYTIQPEKGIVPPGSENVVQIAVQPQGMASQVMQNGDKFIVRSTKVSEGFRVEDITEHEEGSKVIDEVDLMVVSEPVEGAVSPKAIVSSSYEDGARRQLDRRNFHPPENFSHSQATNMAYLVRASDRVLDVTRGAMGSLLHKLGVLDKEFDLKTSVEKDADELVKMQQVLRKVSDVQQDILDDQVKCWASNVREMSYDLEDFVDGFLVHREPGSDGSGHRGARVRDLTHEMYLEKGKSHQPIDDLIKHHISKQVQHAAEKCKKYNVDNTVANATTKADIEDPRFSAIYIPREQLIGIEEPKKVLISLLEEGGEKSKLKIVSIVGLGGLGKTTLAKAVYDKLKAQYHTRAFVLMGQNTDVKTNLKNILYACGNDLNAANLDVSNLLDELHEFLENKRYFIVIDDIWDSLKWNGIRRAFPENKNGSRVITTTRIENVARACCEVESKNFYRMKPLSDEESRRLFYRRTFGPEKDCPDTPRKYEISKYILKRCGGMPLAINSIASLLNGEEDPAWENVWKSLGALTEGKTAVDNMNEILDLSYIHLPDDLKTCLLYVCMYPEDWNINKNDLLRQWVAEGFVSRKGRLDAEDVAQTNFKALINMCMIQPGEIDDYSNEVLSCRVHDLILDLIRSKSTEVNFIQVIDGSKEETGAGEIRRVSVHDGTESMRILETINKRSLEHVRSVFVCRTSLIPYFLVFKHVRVLHVNDNGLPVKGLDLTGISRLFLLRYLKVEMFLQKLKLPDQIGQLQQLETIDLKGGTVEKYPSDIVSLPRLSHLRICNSDAIVLPDGISRMKSLRTLQGVDLYGCSVDNIKGFGELTNLTNLHLNLNQHRYGVCRVSDEEAAVCMNVLLSSISRLSTSLRILTMDVYECTPKLDLSRWNRTLFPGGSHIRKLHLSMCNFQRCPEWVGQLQDLYCLIIRVREVADSLSIVAGLCSLAYFELFNCTREEDMKEESVVIPGTGSGAFQALKHLILHSKYILLTFEKGAMPKLEKLEIPFHCNIIRRFANIPVGIEHLPAPTLKEIDLSVSTKLDDWKVKGSQHWSDSDWEVYFWSDHHDDKLREHKRKTTTMLNRAFKSHHPNADICIHFDYHDYDSYSSDDVDEENYAEDGHEEHDEDAYDDEDYYFSEEDDECAYQVNGSETSAQVQADTGQVELIEAQEDSGRMSIDTDAPPTLLHLAVGPEGRTEDLESLQELPLTSLTNLALCSSPDRAGRVANFPLDINNDLFFEQGINGMLVNAEAVDDDPRQDSGEGAEDNDDDPAFWDKLLTDSDEGAEDNDHDPAFWDNLLMDSDNEREAAVGQA